MEKKTTETTRYRLSYEELAEKLGIKEEIVEVADSWRVSDDEDKQDFIEIFVKAIDK